MSDSFHEMYGTTDDPWAEQIQAAADDAAERACLEAEQREEEEAERIEPCVCGGTGNHDGQSVDSCDECTPLGANVPGTSRNV